MPNSPRLVWPIPDENIDPWYDAFTDLVTAQDASAYAPREDVNALGFGGGSFTFTASSGELNWSGTFAFTASITGFQWQVAAGSVTLTPGQLGYLVLPRAPIGNQTLTMQVGNQIPTGNDAFVVCVRVGSKVHFRNGVVLSDGGNLTVFDGSSGLVGAYIPVTMATGVAVGLSSDVVIGGYQFNPSTSSAGDNMSMKFAVTACGSAAGLTGNVKLYDTINRALIETLTFTGAVAPVYQEVTVTVPGATTVYELRANVTGSTHSYDTFFVEWAGLKVSLS